jgi:hypothetical protein
MQFERQGATVPPRRHVAGKLIGTVILAVLLTVAVSGPTIAHAASNSGSAWSTARTWPYAQTQGGPALATYNGDLYAAWVGQTPNQQVWYSDWTGSSFSVEQTIPAAGTANGPALAVFGGLLWAAWVGTGSPAHLWYATFNGTNWSAEAEVPTALAAKYSAPAFAAYDGKLYIAWVGQSSPYGVWYSAFNGTTWSSEFHLASTATCYLLSTCNAEEDNVGLAVYNSKLYASWSDLCSSASGYCISSEAFNGTSWSGRVNRGTLNPDYAVISGPAAAAFGGDLYEAYFDNYYEEVLYQTFNGSKWSNWHAIAASLYSPTCYEPALATFQGALVVAWQNGSSTSCSTNGSIDFATDP